MRVDPDEAVVQWMESVEAGDMHEREKRMKTFYSLVLALYLSPFVCLCVKDSIL